MKSKSILFFLFFLFLFAGCKYEEGPDISFRTACDRVEGDWVIESFTVDGADSLSDLLSKFSLTGNCCDFYNFHESDNNDDLFISGYVNGFEAYTGKWDLHDDNKYLTFSWEFGPEPYGPFFLGVKWRIIRLANKEMWLETVFINHKNYEVKFKAK